jgi:peptidoglycan hydrolase-like protein with peptidoglycan-binding domain
VGNDVRQLNRNLHQLGYAAAAGVDIAADDNTFTAKTERALRALQQDKGLAVTGRLELDDAVFQPDAVRVAQVTGELGGPAQPGARVLYGTSDTPEVQVNLDPSQQGEVKKGDRAQIMLPGNQSVTGEVDRLGRVAQVPPGQENNGRAGAATIPAYISFDEPAKAGGLDKAPVQVSITTRGVENVLSVPVTALVGKSGSGFAVEVVRPDGRRELVAVRLGLFDTAGGRVQVEGDVREGDQVVVPSL